MKTYTLLFALATCLLCCKKEQQDIDAASLTCYSKGNYAKTLVDAQQKLTGVWKFSRLIGGYVLNPTNPPVVANVMLTFRADSQVVVTVDGQEKTPVSYSITPGPLSYDSANSGLLLELGNRLEYPGFSLGNSTIFVCDTELVLDYGLVVDGTAQVYNRAK